MFVLLAGVVMAVAVRAPLVALVVVVAVAGMAVGVAAALVVADTLAAAAAVAMAVVAAFAHATKVANYDPGPAAVVVVPQQQLSPHVLGEQVVLGVVCLQTSAPVQWAVLLIQAR